MNAKKIERPVDSFLLPPCSAVTETDRVLDNLQLEPHDFVVDLGCGDGRWLLAAAQRGCTGRGLDLNEDLLRKGRLAAAEARVRCARTLHIAQSEIFASLLRNDSKVRLGKQCEPLPKRLV